ncbi:hypothetical protein JCM9533A_23070 [Catenuloplanes niger JCM 9533]|uniref:Uncharacterized protein n=1 Tax=Catenuloplanes niger TaxID=587534 RepID=A0AAE4A036_9ACTN|nr:hypothetical protein [Catenuloplanes niger]
MTEAWTVASPTWQNSTPTWRTYDLRDSGIRYADKMRLRNGWIYKAIGDLHPEAGILSVPDWAPLSAAPSDDLPHRDRMVKVRDHRWPDGRPTPRQLAFAYVPVYHRAFELVR